MKQRIYISIATIALLCIFPAAAIEATFEGLAAFEKKCAAVPEFPKQFGESLVSLEQFNAARRDHAAAVQKQLASPTMWVQGQMPENAIFAHERISPLCAPFVQRVIVPNGTTVALFGDLHGSIHGLMRSLRMLQKRGFLDNTGKMVKDNFRMFFLGDFVDRGYYGVEVTYILMQLKIANPEKVFLVRGNHEDVNINVMGFTAELAHKFKTDAPACTWYDLLPAAIYLGSPAQGIHYNYMLCCHGGLETGFDPKPLLEYSTTSTVTCQLIDRLDRKKHIDTLNGTIKQEIFTRLPDFECIDNIAPEPTNLGFLWSDFIIDDATRDTDTSIVRYTFGRGWMFGKPLTQALLAQQSTQTSQIRGIIRAHQHYGPMLERLRKNHGMASLWNGLVHTFLSAPSVTQDLSSCGFGLLTTANTYQNWSISSL